MALLCQDGEEGLVAHSLSLHGPLLPVCGPRQLLLLLLLQLSWCHAGHLAVTLLVTQAA